MANHIEGFRRLWMFPRNIRKIHPWKISQLISIFHDLYTHAEWHGNQELQDQFCKLLEESGLKRYGEQYNPKSGGSRTYYKQLELLGLVYRKEDKNVYLTIAGEKILNGEPPLPILQKLLLKVQYPSVYSESMNVKINPEIKVRPFQFILKLLSKKEIQYMSSLEFSIPVIWGHDESCIDECVTKIKQLRNGETISDLIGDNASLLYTHKTVGRSIEDAIEDIKNIGNTCKNYLESCNLIDKIDKSFFDTSTVVYTMSEQSVERLKDVQNLPLINSVTSAENFQREFGRIDKKRDSRIITSKESVKIDPEIQQIKRLLVGELSRSGTSFDQGVFKEKMISNYGFSALKIDNTLEHYNHNSNNILETHLYELSKGGTKTANEFEHLVAKIFDQFEWMDASHTGQNYRSKGIGGYTDILIELKKEEKYILIDTKASPRYSLPSNDFAKIVSNYIPNSHEVTEKKKMISFGLIAGGFSTRIEERLKQIELESGCKSFAMTSGGLILLEEAIKKSRISYSEFIKLVKSCKLIDYNFLKNNYNLND